MKTLFSFHKTILLFSVVELTVAPVLRHELVVGSSLDDAALLQNHDTVAVLDRGEPVGDDKRGPARHQLIHAVLHQALGSGIDGGRGLVEDQHRRIGHGRAGDREKLSLPLA